MPFAFIVVLVQYPVGLVWKAEVDANNLAVEVVIDCGSDGGVFPAMFQALIRAEIRIMANLLLVRPLWLVLFVML